MKISILLPYYNDGNYLTQSIQSVLNQTYTNFELILIDHASTDGSQDIALSFNDARIKHIKIKENAGAGGGLIMKEFLGVATGDYFKSFCADDVMDRNCLSKFMIYIIKNPHIDLLFGNMSFIDKDSKFVMNGKTWWDFKGVENIDEIALIKRYLTGYSSLPYPTAICKMQELRKIKIDTVSHAMFDMKVWLQILCNDCVVKLVDDVVVYYRLHVDQASSSSKIDKIIKVSNFESMTYVNYFKIISVTLLKEIFPRDIFAQTLEQEDADLIEFVVAHHFLSAKHPSYKIGALLKIHDLLNDDEMRERINKKLGYSVRDFRDYYASINIFNEADRMSSKELFLLALKKLRRAIKSKFKRKKEGELTVI